MNRFKHKENSQPLDGKRRLEILCVGGAGCSPGWRELFYACLPTTAAIHMKLVWYDDFGVGSESGRGGKRKTQTFTEGKTMLLFYQHMDTLSFCVVRGRSMSGWASPKNDRRTLTRVKQHN